MSGTDANPLNERAVARSTRKYKTTAFTVRLEERCTKTASDEQDHERRDREDKRHGECGERQCDPATAMLLKLWTQKSDNRPGEDGQRSGTGTLHGLARERMIGVLDVGRSQRHCYDCGNQGTHGERQQSARPPGESLSQQGVHRQEIRSWRDACHRVRLVERGTRQSPAVHEVSA